VEHGALTIRNGFTHFPEKQELYRFFPGEPEVPSRIIIQEGSGNISLDVLSWLAQQNVSLVRIDWRGNIRCVVTQSGYAANPYRVEWQRETRADPGKRLEFSIKQIIQKIESSILTLEKAITKCSAWNTAMEAAYSSLAKLDAREPKNIVELRALEANAAAAYFRAWRGMPIKWRGTSRRPIPDTWKKIGQRTSLFHRAGNRNSSHPVNSILNYGYTVLQSQLQIQLTAEGYDPTIGIMHEENNGSAAFIFDMMEPHRPEVDRKILEFVRHNVFDAADFAIRSDGVCRLNPAMARCVAGLLG
jgi:CRISPR-associated endonuclease Cas1